MAHFSFASLFQIGLLFIFICWTKESTGAAFSLEEEFKQLKENYIQMKEIVKNFESKVTELESEVTELKAKDVQMQNKMNELELKDVEMRDKIAQQDSLLSDLLIQKSAPMRSNESAVAINGLPSSCDDLKTIGHTLNGFYSVAGSAMMESVYCDFTQLPSDAGFQKWIGFIDVKSTPVHFYVQRNSSYTQFSTSIPFQVEVVNEGNAMNLTTGKFTAPRPGIYFFSFTGNALFPASSSRVVLGVALYLNEVRIGVGQVEESNNSDNHETPLTLQSTLNLKSGDQVWVAIWSKSTGAYLYDDQYHFNHFTGFMLQEDIIASL